MPPPAPTRTDRDREAIRLAARRELARRSFPDFLARCVVDDPHRGPIAFVPWPHLIARAEAWQAGGDECILKARQLGLSWLVACYAAWIIWQRASSKVLVISKNEDDAKDVVAHARFVLEHLPWPPKLDTDNVTTIRVGGGGTCIAKAATKDAGRGSTASLVIVDEAAFHPWAAENFKAYRPTMADGGQLLVLSTANGIGGWFHEKFWAAEAGRAEGMTAQFIPWHARPGRDAAWLQRERSQYEGNPAEFQQEYPNTPQEAFVGLEGLVYPMFDRERHVRALPPVPWEETWERRYAIDLGGGDPTAVVRAGTYRRVGEDFRIHVYGLMYKTSGAASVDELNDYLAPYSEPGWTQGEGDPAPGGESISASLRALGYPCRRGFAARGDGIALVAMYLERGWLTFSPECEAIFREFASYRWKPQTDPNSKERYATKTPQDHHGDALDALRLLVIGYHRDKFGSEGAFDEVFSEVEL